MHFREMHELLGHWSAGVIHQRAVPGQWASTATYLSRPSNDDGWSTRVRQVSDRYAKGKGVY